MSITTFTAEAQTVIRDVYRILGEVRQIVQQYRETPEAGFAALRQLVTRARWDDLIYRVGFLNVVAQTSGADSAISDKVIHDLRGGALQALAIQLYFIAAGMTEPRDLVQMFYLVRDHMKIMRNALPDLDPEQYALDRSDKLHNVALLIEKWQDAALRVEARDLVHVQVMTNFDGSIATRCLEFSALDRVLYNLMNNALRHTTTNEIGLAMLPLPPDKATNLRFVVANRVSAEQQLRLREQYSDNLGNLFQGGFTTGGTGLGMRICADFVRKAYGLAEIEQGVREGYLGVTLLDDYFLVWFHWPLVDN